MCATEWEDVEGMFRDPAVVAPMSCAGCGQPFEVHSARPTIFELQRSSPCSCWRLISCSVAMTASRRWSALPGWKQDVTARILRSTAWEISVEPVYCRASVNQVPVVRESGAAAGGTELLPGEWSCAGHRGSHDLGEMMAALVALTRSA
jgi:hypothetical protein